MERTERAISTMVDEIVNAIASDLTDVYSVDGYALLKLVLSAYNDFMENEYDGSDYIFNIDNTDDVKCCIDGGMTTDEICGLWLGSQSQHTKYFYFGCNHPQAEPISTLNELRMQLISWLEDIVTYVVAYPYSHESYKKLYATYVTDAIIGK